MDVIVPSLGPEHPYSLVRTVRTLSNSKLKSEHPHLISEIIKVVINWSVTWKNDPNVKPWLNRGKTFATEIEESIYPLAKIFALLKKNPSTNFTIYDLAAGKGFLSILLSFLLPSMVPEHSVDQIIMVDMNFCMNNEPCKKGKTINISHINAINSLAPVKMTPIKTNLHDKQIIELIQNNQTSNSYQTPNPCQTSKNILVGIHLCRRLSSRFIEIFHSSDSIKGFILAPCCTPNAGGNSFKIFPNAVEIDPSEIHKDSDPYSKWTDILFENIIVERNEKEREKVQLSGGDHKCNTFFSVYRN